MKWKDILKKLQAAGLVLKEGANHTKVLDAKGNCISAVPRHNEVNDNLADFIAQQTGVQLRGGKK